MQAGNDKIVKTIVKKVGAHPLGVDEINFFRDDNTILHFKNPEGNSPPTQPMPPFRIIPSSSVENQKPRPSRISSPTSSSSSDPSNTDSSKNSSPACSKAVRKSPTWWKKPQLRTWTQLNEDNDQNHSI
jgi:hypothetical protein